jgi:hypothetical protein
MINDAGKYEVKKQAEWLSENAISMRSPDLASPSSQAAQPLANKAGGLETEN